MANFNYANFYRNQTDLELRIARSKKVMRLHKILTGGWFNEREANALRSSIKAIDVELASREAQLRRL